MSRCYRDAIFADYTGDLFSSIAKCPVCDTTIKKDAKKGSKLHWERGHIYALSLGGPDLYPNLIPLCTNCNGKMGNTSMWEYKAKLGKITESQAKKFSAQTIKNINDFDPICIETLATGKRCSRRKYGYTVAYCRKHILNHYDYMEITEDYNNHNSLLSSLQ